MDRNESIVESIRKTMTLLEEKTLPLIDFDSLKSQMEELAENLCASADSVKELALLRHDYVSRISGMLKAIAACDRKKSGLKEALTAIESLDKLDSSELTRTFRKTSARFRDCFPASFGLLYSDATSTLKGYSLRDYK